MRPTSCRQKNGASLRIALLIRSYRAFTLVEFLIALGTAIILIALFLPAIASRPTRAPRINCASNLKQVGLAFCVWANDHDDKFPMAVSITKSGSMEYIETGEVYRHFQVMSNEVISPKILACSADRERKRATNLVSFNNRNLSYFVGVEADESNPDMILSGDRNITGGASAKGHLLIFRTNSSAGWSKALHNTQGNVALADGSVQQVNIAALQKQIQRVTNEFRLAIPLSLR
jgi:prepilin-type processing-associated H-X9-DG protein